jgi:4-hydroxy-tetrahydrodipicolinate reductase
MSAIRLAIAGAAGRMGQALFAAAEGQPDLTIVAGTERDTGLQAALPFPLFAAPADAMAGADVWIDFTTPSASVAAAAALADSGVKAAIIGTTGLSEAEEAKIALAAQRLPIVKAGNFSLGVAVLSALVRQAARALGAGYDIEIEEAHHRNKVDAPSGTALMLGDAAAAGRGASLASLRLPPRDGVTGPRPQGGIGFSATRGGGIVGRHSVLFAGHREIVTLRHEALDRGVFADGALAAARWALTRSPGLYAITDVVGLQACGD